MTMTAPEQALPPGLYLVGTPIGNRSDWSSRAKSILQQVDAIACEDTRHAQKLLQDLVLTASFIACHEHNELSQAEKIVAAITSGKRIALMTDAGMPAISDPGFRVVRACRKADVPVVPIPGPVAFTTAWAASGLPTDGILFLGFLPAKSAARIRTFQEHRDSPFTLGFYESTHRIEKFIDDLIEVLGPERCICVARELTKLHESILTGPSAVVREKLLKGSTKGEFVVLIAKEGFCL